MRFVQVILVLMAAMAPVLAQETVFYDFNSFKNGPIDGQMDWNVFEMVADSSAISIMDELGTSEAKGDRALVLRSSSDGIRCVSGEPVRWLPGRTLKLEFDFKIAVEAGDISMDKPVMTVLVGDSLLSNKAHWSLHLMAVTNGDWRLEGAMPERAEKKIYAENYLLRTGNETAISGWHKFELVIKKESEPDSFSARAQIQNAKSGNVVADIEFMDGRKDKVAAAMWNTARAHAGFLADPNQLGIVCIDNLRITSSK